MTNLEFAELWKSIWFVHIAERPLGLGHITSQVDENGNVKVGLRVDFSVANNDDPAHPEKANARVWLESELLITDAADFSWSVYRSAEGASPAAAEIMAKHEMKYDDETFIKPIDSARALSIQNKNVDIIRIEANGDGPIVPDALAHLVVQTLPRDKAIRSPVRLLGFGRTMQNRQWQVGSTQIRYAGHKGPQTGLNNTFESCPPDGGRVFSLWFDENDRFVGWGDEVESILSVGDEETGRAFLAGGASSSK